MASLESFSAASLPRELSDAELVAELQARGWIAHKDAPTHRRVPIDAPVEGRVRFAVVSDTHLGSKYQQLTHLRDFYEKAREFGAEFMLHGGDLVDGSHKMHRGMEFEQHVFGALAQGRYAAEALPVLRSKRGKPLPTYVIGGNHDGSFWKDAGADVIDVIRSRRDDVVWLGAPAATFTVSGLEVGLLHPDGGPSYARSYRLQKIVEQTPAQLQPDILICGHWHVAAHVPCYGHGTVEAFCVPSFQAQTPYLARKGLHSMVGGLLVEAEYTASGLASLTTRWQIYRDMVENDWP